MVAEQHLLSCKACEKRLVRVDLELPEAGEFSGTVTVVKQCPRCKTWTRFKLRYGAADDREIISRKPGVRVVHEP